MGGRGGYSADVSKRATGLTRDLESIGLPVTKSQKEVENILKKHDSRRIGEYVYNSHISDYQRGFNRTANADNKKGYKEEKDALMKKISDNPRKVNKITTNAQNKYKKQLASLETKMSNPNITNDEYKKTKSEYDKTYGKFQAANFINWSRKS